MTYDFFRAFSPPELADGIEWNTLELARSDSVDEKLHERRSDLRFSVMSSEREVEIVLICEHKSYHDDEIGFEMIEYTKATWKDQKAAGKERTEVIFFVLYHGEKRWTLGDDLLDMVGVRKKKFPGYSLNGRCVPIDVPRLDEKDIRGSADVQAFLHLLRGRISRSNMKGVEKAVELWKEVKHKMVVQAGISYISAASDLTKEDVIEVMERKAMKNGKKLVMTPWEKEAVENYSKGLDEGFTRGIEQGIEQGKMEGLFEGIEDTLEIKFGEAGLKCMKSVRRLRDLNKVEKVRIFIKKAKDIKEVKTFVSKI
ncbi:MAG: Rpn family recombination-promoting nuclease/putative transposase [Planctomycetes bacterium]|nr:Rpn family recombination-promoting nuclease/putative transposase [Planctomycetota bacterium]